MGTNRIHFGHAFERWEEVCREEGSRLKKKGNVDSWEALDHLSGLAAECGLKAFLIHERIKTAGPDGDYPKSGNHRPHVNELWNEFEVCASGRMSAGDWRSLNSSGAAFSSWDVCHRYAPDGTVTQGTVETRLKVVAALRKILREKMVY